MQAVTLLIIGSTRLSKMSKDKFMRWLEEHGHTIGQDHPYYETIKKRFEKKPYDQNLAFAMALDTYLSDDPVENFFVNDQYIYAPRFPMYQVHALKDPEPSEKLTVAELKHKIDIIESRAESKHYRKRVSKHKDTIKELIDAKPESIDLDKILGTYS